MERVTAAAEPVAHAEARAVEAPLSRSAVAAVLALQRTVGNRGTTRLLGTRRALARAPLDAVPAAQRRGLREVTDALATIDVAAIHTPPGATGGGARVSGTITPAPSFGAGIDAGLRPVLTSVLAHIVPGALPANSSSALQLDLTPYGGASKVYRFTHVSAGDPAQPSYFIEEVGTSAAAPRAPVDAANAPVAFARGKFDAHSFSVTGGDREFEAVIRAAVEMVADAMLTPIDGAGFVRSGTDPHDARVGGRYDHQAHTVTIYDPGMTQTTARFGDAGTTTATGPRLRTILHELGHALDEASLRGTWRTRETARRAFETAFSQYDTGGGNYSFPGNLQGQFNRLSGAATAADTAYTRTRSETGHSSDGGDTAATATATAFTRALAADGGVTLTAYAESARGEDHHVRETYAEAFSMFVTEPETLRAMRPQIYAYFAALAAGRRPR